MKKRLLALIMAITSAPASAQSFPGSMIAEYYMNEMSTPKGWALSYKGREAETEVFIMDRDLDAHPQTAFLQPIDQMRRVMCGDKTLKAMLDSGTVIRVDARDKKGGQRILSKGPQLTRC